jgi:RNA polymerase sigma-70 factor, ECF subfamily
MDDDGGLLEAWRRGDLRAGDALVERYSAIVVRFFRSKLGDDIDDFVQQTFTDVVRARDRLSSGSFRAYLLSVARHRLVDELRRRFRRPEALDIATMSLEDIGTSLSQRFARDERKLAMLRALRGLPVDFQIVLELAYWEDLSGAEIAVVLGVPPNTVRSRLARARVALREALPPGEPLPADTSNTES